jgi:hypothetical protein
MRVRAVPVQVGGPIHHSFQRREIMNTKRLTRILLIVVPALLALGCAPVAPLMTITDQPIEASRPASLDEIGNAIIRAGASLNMQMRKVRPGIITATYVPMGGAGKGLSATMEVKYNTKSYSIEYKDSQGLKYDGTNIHRNYNKWVQSLDSRIRVQLTTM